MFLWDFLYNEIIRYYVLKEQNNFDIHINFISVRVPDDDKIDLKPTYLMLVSCRFGQQQNVYTVYIYKDNWDETVITNKQKRQFNSEKL